MNTKLIDSLVKIINSLSKEERAVLEAKLTENQRNSQIYADFAKEPFVGMWKNRTDLADSNKWLRQLRQTEWTNKHD